MTVEEDSPENEDRERLRPLPAPWRNARVLTSIASGLLLLAGWLTALAGGPAAVETAAYLAGMVVGGWFFAREAAEELVLEREIGIELLMTIAAVVAAAMGQLFEAAMLAFLYSISEALEGYAEQKTRGAVRSLMSLAPRSATVLRDGREVEVAADDLLVGDLVLVRPGAAVPADATVVTGRSSVDQAMLTGESAPVDVQPGAEVFAGTVNGRGALEVRVDRRADDTALARIVRLVAEAQERRGRGQRMIDRFGSVYSPAVLAAGAAVAILPPLLTGASWTEWATRATVLIVSAAPCALVISIPVTMVAALGTAARHGVLVKGGLYMEELARLRVIAFDKTGTLTRGEPVVTDVLGIDGTPQAEVLRVAAGVEAASEHPLGRAIVRRAAVDGSPPRFAEHRSFSGAGATAVDPASDGRALYFVGALRGRDEPDAAGGRNVGGSLVSDDPSMAAPLPLADDPTDAVWATAAKLAAEGKTVVAVQRLTHLGGGWKEEWPALVVRPGAMDPARPGAEDPDARPLLRSTLGLIGLRDEPRPEAAAAVAECRRLGLRTAMLSGDNRQTAEALGRALGIDDIRAPLAPEDKLTAVEDLVAAHGHVGMVGDGVNDAPALAAATVGIAMGAAGTDVALETADAALMGDDLAGLGHGLRLARRTRRIVIENLALSILVIAGLATGAVIGAFSLAVAVAAHEFAEIVVIANGLRMLRG